MIWRAAPGFPAYEVSSTGLVRTKLGKVRLAFVWNQGHLRVRLVKDGRAHDKRINVLVLETFVGPRPTSMHKCVYLDGNRTNTRAQNLKWGRRIGRT